MKSKAKLEPIEQIQVGYVFLTIFQERQTTNITNCCNRNFNLWNIKLIIIAVTQKERRQNCPIDRLFSPNMGKKGKQLLHSKPFSQLNSYNYLYIPRGVAWLHDEFLLDQEEECYTTQRVQIWHRASHSQLEPNKKTHRRFY